MAFEIPAVTARPLRWSRRYFADIDIDTLAPAPPDITLISPIVLFSAFRFHFRHIDIILLLRHVMLNISTLLFSADISLFSP
jgi:hypothetical protein